MKTHATICFLIPYFGHWPFWLPFFLQSCRYNLDINWLFFTDCGTPGQLPPNVKIKNISYEAYCQQVSKTLDIDFKPPSPYKLCDIKPALGYIHADEIATYDFWAFGDIDVIYGNLRAYFSDEKLATHDLISTHQRRISGHLCVIRNNQKMREAFMQVKDWQQQLVDEQHRAFDEKAYSRLFMWRKNFPEPLFTLVGKLNPWRRRSEFNEAYSTPGARIAWTDGSYHFPESWHWQAGSLTTDRDGDRQFPYLHFFVWKWSWSKTGNLSADEIKQLATAPGWQIDSRGFHP